MSNEIIALEKCSLDNGKEGEKDLIMNYSQSYPTVFEEV
jgi:hypothetical protein